MAGPEWARLHRADMERKLRQENWRRVGHAARQWLAGLYALWRRARLQG